jgi:hypothetical protein
MKSKARQTNVQIVMRMISADRVLIPSHLLMAKERQNLPVTDADRSDEELAGLALNRFDPAQ